jgi:high-affinity iron transporter
LRYIEFFNTTAKEKGVEGATRFKRHLNGAFRVAVAWVPALLALQQAGCANPSPSGEEGRMLYKANGCASCHGLSGHGDGPVAASLPARPADLRNPAHFLRGDGEAAIAATLAEGISGGGTPNSFHHALLMPKFDHLTEPERRSIALYVISLRNKKDTGKGPD